MTQTHSTPRRPRRTVNRLAIALLAILLGGIGQYFFTQDALLEGAFFYGIAVILFVGALASRFYEDEPTDPNLPLTSSGSESLDEPVESSTSPYASGWRAAIGQIIILLAVAIAGYATFLFGEPSSDPYSNLIGLRDLSGLNTVQTAWYAYLLSLMLLIIGVLTLTRSETSLLSEIRRLIPNRYIFVSLLLIVFIACFLRLYNFTEQPFGVWFDEAQAGLVARQINADPTYRPVFYMPINLTGHLLGLYALALDRLGDDIESLRLVSVMFGVGGVIAAYLFGRELHSARFGLVLAFLIAVMRWHINFSRVAMTGIDTPFFELLSLFFLVRLWRWGKLRDAMFAGLTLGFGLTFYTAFRLFLAALVVFAVLSLLPRPERFSKPFGSRLRNGVFLPVLMLIFTLVLTVNPLLHFAVNNWDEFTYRMRQASILTKRDQADLVQAVWTTTEKHLLMFHVQGDANGRHNLPGEPMLDPLMGVLFILGVGILLMRPFRLANLLMLLLFPATLAGGILSVDFEAPQALRAIGVIPILAYVCTLAIMALWREAERALTPLPQSWVTVPGLLLAGFILYWNGTTYLITQANDFSSWTAFSTPETIAAKKMAELGPAYQYYSSPFLTNHPAIRFIAPDAPRQERFTLPDAMPIREPAGRPVGLFIHPDDSWIYERARQFYPNAQFELIDHHTEPGRAVIYFVNLQPSDLAAIQGLELRYTPTVDNPIAQQFGVQAQRTLNVRADWPDDAPDIFDDMPYQAEWRGILYVPQYGPHGFTLRTPATGTLEIDGNLLLEGSGEQTTGLTLAEGNHTIRVRADGASGEVSLEWQPPYGDAGLIPQWSLYVPPVTNHGLLGRYYANPNFEGNPVFQRIDPFLDIYWHIIPLQRPYSVEWVGSLVAPQSGLYRLGLKAVPASAELSLNGQTVLTTLTPNQLIDTALTLEAGRHDIAIRFQDTTDRSRIHLYWMPPSGPFEPIPTENLWPPLGEYPQADAPSLVSELGVNVETSLNLRWLTTLTEQFSEPRDVATLSDGRIVVADTGNRRVQLFDSAGAYLQDLPDGDEPFEEPLAVVVNSRDEILVLESTLQWIYRYNSEGDYLNRFGGPSARLFHPRGLNLLPNDGLVVADTGGARFVIFDDAETILSSIGGLGSGPGQLNEPTDVLQDQFGTFFVAEAENNRLQRLDAAGNPLGQWAIPPAYAYDGPHLAFAPDGSLFMTNSQTSSLLRYAPDGNLLDEWQTLGPTRLLRPVGVHFDEITRRLYLTDVQTNQVHVLAVE